MKPLTLLITVLVAFLAAMGIIFGAPPYIEAPTRLFLGLGFVGGLALIFKGPIGQAIGTQLKGEVSDANEGRVLAQLEEMSGELQAVRDELGQLHERMDFTERLLTQQNSRQQVGPGAGSERA